MTFKLKVYKQYVAALTAKLQMLQKSLQELIDSAGNETKSTAGDKYETGRAMLHIEQDNVRRQIAEAMEQKAVLDSLNPDYQAEQVSPGSLVQTKDAFYYISAALGKIEVAGRTVVAISPASPMGSSLMGRKVGERVGINGKEILLIEVI